MKTWPWLLSGIILVACVSIWSVQRTQISGKTKISYEAILGDLDGDKDIDALLTSGAGGTEPVNTLWINQGGMQGNSQGKFSPSIQKLGNKDSRSAALGDLDGDGDQDVVFGTTNGFEVYLNSGGPQGGWKGDFQLQYEKNFSNLVSEFWRAALGDLDSDGDLDAFFSVCCGEAAGNSIWVNDGQGKFTEREFISSVETEPRLVALGDLDGDLDLDVWVVLDGVEQSPDDGTDFDSSSQIWINDGSGYFTDSWQRLGTGAARAVALGDLDADGDLDACISGGGNTTIWENNGIGRFNRSAQMSSQLSAQVVLLGDLDLDRDLDLLLSSGNFVETWLNHGNGTFERSDQRINLQKYSAVALGDLDGDMDLDLFTGYLNNRYRVWWNDGFGRLGLSWR